MLLVGKVAGKKWPLGGFQVIDSLENQQGQMEATGNRLSRSHEAAARPRRCSPPLRTPAHQFSDKRGGVLNVNDVGPNGSGSKIGTQHELPL